MAKRQGKDAVAQRGVDDLVLLPKIGEQDILANLEKRYMNDLIYVWHLTCFFFLLFFYFFLFQIFFINYDIYIFGIKKDINLQKNFTQLLINLDKHRTSVDSSESVQKDSWVI